MGGLKAAGKTVVPHCGNNLGYGRANIRGIAKGIQYWRDYHLPHAVDQQAYTAAAGADTQQYQYSNYMQINGLQETSFVAIQYVKKS